MPERVSLSEMHGMLVQVLRKLDKIETDVSILSQQSSNPEYMTAQQAADYLGFTKQTVYNKVHKGELHAYKPGGRWTVRFKRSELTEYMDKRR